MKLQCFVQKPEQTHSRLYFLSYTGVNNESNDGSSQLSLNSFKFLRDKYETLKVWELQGHDY